MVDLFHLAPHSPKQRGPRLNLRMKSVSLDSPDCGPEDHSGSGLVKRNMSVPKVVDQLNQSDPSNNGNFGVGVGNRRYGTWANVVRSRMAAAQAAQNPNLLPKKMIPPSSMEFRLATSAPASHNQCNLISCFIDWLSWHLM